MTIGTRGSPLALAQAHQLQSALSRAHGVPVEDIAIQVIRTTGDMIQDRALSESGGKGLFTKEIDAAQIDGSIDIAVHSSKDLPTLLPDALCIAAFLPREDVRDALICPSAASIRNLPHGARVGTASLRRGAQVKRLRPDAQIVLIRGNVETRLRKIANGEADATLLALAGLKRLGLDSKAQAILETDDFLPAVGQGAIGITARRGDRTTLERLAAIGDSRTMHALTAERAFLGVVDGSCRTPIAGLAVSDGERISFRGIILRPDGSEFHEVAETGTVADAQAIGLAAGRDLRSRAPADMFG
ncbi:MAG: hydroxymethylbilane synthase [Hyphomicrobiales bacterium]|nr:hydroxymethylbilane synthase [Hyphomicrobiales bacterium]